MSREPIGGRIDFRRIPASHGGNMFRVAIVELDVAVVADLRNCLARFAKAEGVTFETVWFTDGMELVEKYSPVYDVILLKTALPLFGGLETARKIREVDHCVEIILISPDTSLAIAGYSVQAADYLVLPIRYEAFERALRKTVHRAEAAQNVDMLIRSKGVYRRISAKEVLYVEVRGHYLVYHLFGETITVLGQLTSIEKKLMARGFFRCSAGYMVNMRYIDRFTRNSVCIGEQEFPISRSKKAELFGRLGVIVGRKCANAGTEAV